MLVSSISFEVKALQRRRSNLLAVSFLGFYVSIALCLLYYYIKPIISSVLSNKLISSLILSTKQFHFQSNTL